MTILVTGGTGRTGGAVARRLHEANFPYLVLTRSGTASAPYEANACRFDFLDPGTFGIPFDTAKTPVSAIYVVVPMAVSDEIAKPVTDFIDFAKGKGVKRFVLLSSNVYEPGTRICGAVHQHLIDLGGDVEFCAIRPTWFMENFSRAYVPSIKKDGVIASPSKDGKARWISTDDVGAAAFRALTDTTLTNTDHILLGPELLNYDDIAKILTDVIGKKITYSRISLDEYKAELETYGLVGLRAQIMLELRDELARGVENKPDNGEVLRLTGKAPITFREWAERNKGIWQ
ncbi:hypothetical protein H2200_012063 [Cladophialophora chaetospira]|uniref:NmrA-like domain-containing protein n=1 Tax=Cladophialophora chaetospira TaxID=386627 RepID=A0AA38WY47_9EURO|nr:hypothetical protein H2200_012063 [Cladophialophora chaetospira]